MKHKVITPRRNPTRTRPRWQLVQMMRDVGITQAAIAQRVGVNRAYVSMVLSRRASVRPTKKTEAIWREIEKALA